MRKQPNITMRELQKLVGLSESGVKKNIRKLRESGVIRHVGPSKGGHWEVNNHLENR